MCTKSFNVYKKFNDVYKRFKKCIQMVKKMMTKCLNKTEKNQISVLKCFQGLAREREPKTVQKVSVLDFRSEKSF